METNTTSQSNLDRLFAVGAHFGYSRSRRHPSALPYLFGVKQRVEIFDLEKTDAELQRALEFVKGLAVTGKTILFVGSKPEAQGAVKNAAESIGMPYVAGRWIGGALTNFGEIKKRIMRLEDLTAKREKGELGKYTKRERLMIDREITRLENNFAGLIPMKERLPDALMVVDSRRESIAIAEARAIGVPVIGLANSDCDMTAVDYAIPANDANVDSITFFVNEIAAAYREGAGK